MVQMEASKIESLLKSWSTVISEGESFTTGKYQSWAKSPERLAIVKWIEQAEAWVKKSTSRHVQLWKKYAEILGLLYKLDTSFPGRKQVAKYRRR